MPPRPMKVLLISHDTATQERVKKALIHEDRDEFELESYLNVEKANEYLKTGYADVVLLEVLSAKDKALEDFNHFRTLKSGIPVVALGSLNDDAWALQFVRFGAQDYLVTEQL